MVFQAFKFSNIIPSYILCFGEKVGFLVTVSQTFKFSSMVPCYMFWINIFLVSFLTTVFSNI